MTQTIKQRILVMNGQRLVQAEEGGQWVTQKVVGKAGNLKPGIYSAYLAKDAEQALQHSGVVFHSDDKYVYMLEEQGVTRHPMDAFVARPEIGLPVSITYEEGRARVIGATQSHRLKR